MSSVDSSGEDQSLGGSSQSLRSTPANMTQASSISPDPFNFGCPYCFEAFDHDNPRLLTECCQASIHLLCDDDHETDGCCNLCGGMKEGLLEKFKALDTFSEDEPYIYRFTDDGRMTA